MKIIDFLMTQLANLAIFAGPDSYRWKMKNIGWRGWSVKTAKETKEKVE